MAEPDAASGEELPGRGIRPTRLQQERSAGRSEQLHGRQTGGRPAGRREALWPRESGRRRARLGWHGCVELRHEPSRKDAPTDHLEPPTSPRPDAAWRTIFPPKYGYHYL